MTRCRIGNALGMIVIALALGLAIVAKAAKPGGPHDGGSSLRADPLDWQAPG
jgi:hypothetical protein